MSATRLRIAAAVAIVTVLVAALTAASSASGTDGGAKTKTAPPPFGRVVVVVFENKEFGEVVGNAAAPTFRSLAQRYALLTNYRAVAHPSLPNYLALVSGSTQGITSDCTTCQVSATNLADSLERAGRSWKTYAEGLPRAGFTGPSAGRYAKKHNPFLYFTDVTSSRERLRRIVPLATFRRDLAAGTLPDFSLVVPDLCHDMHDCLVATGDAWLDTFLRPLLRSSALGKGVIFVVFDEGTSNEGGGGHVPALVLGPRVRPRSQTSTPLDHYGLLRTIESAWHLPLLGHSRGAGQITGIWR
jgi:phosphatidylinositol-3-phosphatase